MSLGTFSIPRIKPQSVNGIVDALPSSQMVKNNADIPFLPNWQE
jgi:hypothetical protein